MLNGSCSQRLRNDVSKALFQDYLVLALASGLAAVWISLIASAWTPGYSIDPSLTGILIESTGAAEATSLELYTAAIFYAADTGTLATMFNVAAEVKLGTSY